MPRIGVYICHCGENIAGIINIEEVRKYAASLPGVTVAKDYFFMCSAPGHDLIKQDVKANLINRVVVAACTPKMYEPIFRKGLEEAGLNKYLLEMANLREQVSWVHRRDAKGATAKAKRLIASAVAKAALLEPREDRYTEVAKAVLVIGAGIAGMSAALNTANMGFQVYLVERKPTIGGNMAKLDKTFPANDCAACILTPVMVEVSTHPNIQMLTYAEIESVEGSIGNFRVTVRKKQTYVDWERCTGCGSCTEACPAKVPDEFNEGLTKRRAIYIEFPQALPRKAVLDRDHCLNCAERIIGTPPKVHPKIGELILAPCEKACPQGACDRSVAYDPAGTVVELNVGTIIVATGFKIMDKTPFKEYAPQSPNVITGLQLERILSATGPTEGELERPSDGKKPRTVTFISCVGSRSKYHHPYCSNICCMYMLKQARLIREKYRDVNVYIFFTDVRTGGKGFEEYYTYCRQLGIKIIRGHVGCLEELGRDRLWVRAYDIDIGAPVELESDLVVLATAVEPAAGLDQLSRQLGITRGNEGFLKELHTKLYPVETPIRGIYIAGCAQGPKDIADSVAQARAASAAATIPLAAGKVAVEPLTAEVNPARCSGCGICVPLCPYSAITMAKSGEKLRATVEEMLCVGCGVCTAACPPRAIRLHGFTSTQIEAQIEAITLGIGGGDVA